MAEYVASASLSDTVNRIEVPLPATGGPYIVAIAIFNPSGATLTATFKIQSRAGATGAWTDATVVAVASSGATSANPTAVGNYAATLVANATDARVIISSYTTGTALIKVSLLPVGS